MKAVQLTKYGGPEVLQVTENIAQPTPNKDQVLIEVYAAGLNPFDAAIRSGMLKQMIPLKLPVTFGGDFAGVVKAVGEGVSDYKQGDEVYGSAVVLNGGTGAYAQFTAANAANVSLKPKSASFIEAAALPLAGASAVQALADHLKLASGQKILIHGGAGGVGHMAIQLAKSLGAYVATTVSGDDTEFVKGLGADEVIDYKTQSFETLLKDFDAVFDTVGGAVTEKSFQVLKKGGVLVSMLGQPSAQLAQKYGVTALGQNTKTDAPNLKRLAGLVDSGKIKVHIDREFPLEEVSQAFTHLTTGHPRGKVVLQVKGK